MYLSQVDSTQRWKRKTEKALSLSVTAKCVNAYHCVFYCRYRELEEKLDYLQKSSAQRDRTEALLKQKDKDCAQVSTFKIRNPPHQMKLQSYRW